MAVEDTQPLISHLIELRKRLLNSIICVLAVFVVLVFFANDIYQLVLRRCSSSCRPGRA